MLGLNKVTTIVRMEHGTLAVDKTIGKLVEGGGGRFRVGPLGRELLSDSLGNTDLANKFKEYLDKKAKEFKDAFLNEDNSATIIFGWNIALSDGGVSNTKSTFFNNFHVCWRYSSCHRGIQIFQLGKYEV